jgi:AcrR family transcriptional regulator
MNSQKPEKMDRRVRRTRGLLRAAILELVAERGLDALRIEDITERANLRRATFYMHYRDKEELLTDALTETFDQLAREAEHVATPDGYGGKTRLEAWLVTFRHAEQHHRLYKNLLTGGSGAAFAGRIRDYLAALILRAGGVSVVTAQFIAGAELSMITWWLEQDRPMPAEQIAEQTWRLAMHGLTGLQSDTFLNPAPLVVYSESQDD